MTTPNKTSRHLEDLIRHGEKVRGCCVVPGEGILIQFESGEELIAKHYAVGGASGDEARVNSFAKFAERIGLMPNARKAKKILAAMSPDVEMEIPFI